MIEKNQIKNYLRCFCNEAQEEIKLDTNYILKELEDLRTFIACITIDISPYPYADSTVLKKCYDAYVTSKIVTCDRDYVCTRIDFSRLKKEFWIMMNQINMEDCDLPEDTKKEILDTIDCVRKEVACSSNFN